jgi:hypothetical protein
MQNQIVGEFRVHLDHLVARQSIRYSLLEESNVQTSQSNILHSLSQDNRLRYSDIANNTWFHNVRKPDFQRETNSWTPEDCVEFLDTVVKGRIIPSVILWHNEETGLIYILDGAHRLSVIRAWMIDDWGDKAGSYYERRNKDFIKQIADLTRDKVRREIGSFKDYEEAHKEFIEIGERGDAPKQVMGTAKFAKAIFYVSAMVKHQTLSIQWEQGNYESAEQSFLRINRKGQALDPWEATLIEYRQSSYARCIMSIANGGESGHYWPTPSSIEAFNEGVISKIDSFSERSSKIHKLLFVPPFRVPISDLNVPLMVAPAYFQKHKYLLEVVPIIAEKQIALDESQQVSLMKADVSANPEVVITNADRLLSSMENGLEHLITTTNNSTSLAIVPLFFWYNQRAQYVRGLFYGFIYWLLSGKENDITNKKIIFSANRDAFEYWLFNLKIEISTLQEKGGAGLKGTPKIASFFQAFLELLHNNQNLEFNSDELKSKVIDTLSAFTHITTRNKQTKSSRLYSQSDKTQINIKELFEHSIRCHICRGVVNIQYGGIQYDHVNDYADTKVTDPETGKPTHPFCNRYKKQILSLRERKQSLILPSFNISTKKDQPVQEQLNFWGIFGFPD